MKNICFLLLLVLSTVATALAQGFYLPSSSSSAAAVQQVHEASALFSNIHLKEATEKINKALADDPNCFMAHLYAIQYADKADKQPLIDKALAVNPRKFNPAEKIMRQQLLAWKKDPDAKAGVAMQALVKAYPQTPQAYEWASLHAAHTDKNPQAALQYAQQLAQLAPDFGPNYNTMGYIYMGNKDMPNAKAAFDKYLTLAPTEANAHDSMGDYYLNAQDYAAAVQQYDMATAMGMAGAKARADKARELLK